MGHRLTLYLHALLLPYLQKNGYTHPSHWHALTKCSKCEAEGLACSVSQARDDCGFATFVATAVLGVNIDVLDIDSIVDYPCFLSFSTLV